MAKVCGNIYVHYAHIPLYLKPGTFFQSLTEGEDFEVPRHCFKQNPKIDSQEDFQTILFSLRYWCVEICPDELIAYVLLRSSQPLAQTLKEFSAELKFTSALAAMLESPKVSPITIAYQYGELDLVKYLEANGHDDGNPCKVACIHNRLECLKYARSKNNYLVTGMCEIAVQRGHVECLQYSIENGCAWRISAENARSIGQLWGTVHSVEQHREGYGLCCKDHPCSARHLQCVQYAHDHGHYWGTVILVSAAECGHLACIKYARCVGCPWSRDVTTMCAAGGHVECLQHCIEDGCPLDATESLVAAAEGGHVHCVPLLLSHGARWTPRALTMAARGGHKGFIAYALQHTGTFEAQAAEEVAAQGNLDLLKFLDEHGCPLSEEAYRRAAQAGHWACCDYLLYKQCPMPWNLVRDSLLRGLANVASPASAYFWAVGRV